MKILLTLILTCLDHAEEKVDVEEVFSAKVVTPAAEEQGANDGEQVVHNALPHREL